MHRLKQLDLCQPLGALIAVLLVRVLWGAWAALFSGISPDTPFEETVPMLPPQLLSGEWWHRALVSPWMRHDFEYYELILSRGYSTSDGTASFHPLFPLLAKPFFWISGNAQASLLVVSTLSAWAATLLLARYARRFWDAEGGRIPSIAGWCLLLNPLGWILLAPYTEGTFLAFCIGALWAMRDKRLWLAALLGALATLTRQQGVFLLVPLALTLWRQHISREPKFASRFGARHSSRDWLCLALIPLAYASYSAYRVLVVGEAPERGAGLGTFLASWLVSPSTRIVVPGSGIAPPWRAIEESIYLLRFMPNPYHVFVDAINGWAMVAILVVGWKYLHGTEKWLCAGVIVSSVCFSAQAYMSFPRHLMLAFPLSILVARWSVQRGRTRLVLEVMALESLLLCAGFVRHSWVP